MLVFIKEYYQFLILIAIWIIVGVNNIPVALVIIPLSILLLKVKSRYLELLLGLFVILTMSDMIALYPNFGSKVKPIYIVLLAMFLFLDSKRFQPINYLAQPFLLFFIISLITISNSPIFVTAAQKTFSYIFMFLVIPNFTGKLLRENKEGFLRGIIYVGFFILIAGFVLTYFAPYLTHRGGRYQGIFGNPNGIGLFCGLYFILAYLIYFYNKKLFSIYELVGILLAIVISVILSGSRNAIMTILVFLMFSRLYHLSPFFGFIIFITIIMLYQLIFANLPLILGALGLDEFLRTDTMEGGSGRDIAWSFAWQEIKTHFIFGRGFSYDEHLFTISYFKLWQTGHFGGVHSTYLSMWLNTGLIGLMAFVYGIVRIFIKARNYSHFAFPVMFAVLFSITFESWLMGSLNPFTIQFLIILTLLTSKSFISKEDEDTVLAH
ncbi:MAG: O-antigen ligase family protein [Bacteroidetes bacterium]|nr:O-antigen ligase family protein [Bacteroidota bacterium]